MPQTLELRLLPEVAYQPQLLHRHVARQLSVPLSEVKELRIRRRSIDARQRTILVNVTVDAYLGEESLEPDFVAIPYPNVEKAPPVVVVGAGPGGLFAALRLIELGLRPILLERGKDVHQRRKDIALISRTHQVDSESNYSFGEGGAGAYSDGKLYTRSKKRGDVGKILRVLCQHGAARDILFETHPHIGTDRLPRIIENIRLQILQSGGEVHFQTKVESLLVQGDRVHGVRTADGREYQGPVILATGHSARDVYRYLHASGVEIQSKGIAVGVRLEHPSLLIDQLQYHSRQGRGSWLPTATYNYVTQVRERGVYSFCMCPGGTVVPAATGPQQVVVNGMSSSSRGGAWSNSGMVVETRPEDLEGPLAPFLREALQDEAFAKTHDAILSQSGHPLSVMAFQEILERAAWLQGGRSQCAPAQRMTDFVHRRLSADLPASSYSPGLLASPLHFWMPDFVASRLSEAFEVFGRKSKGFLTPAATVIAMETRTSAPVRILRDPSSLSHVRLKGLYPCGEGAGYAGGIVSAAVDGERCAEACAGQSFAHLCH